MNLRQIREALADSIRAEVARGVTVYPFDPGPTRQAPCIVIEGAEPYVEFRETFGAKPLGKVNLEVTVHVVAGDEISARMALDDFTANDSTSSVQAAIESSRVQGTHALDGLVDDLVCSTAHKPTQAADSGALTVTFDVMVLARKETS